MALRPRVLLATAAAVPLALAAGPLLGCEFAARPFRSALDRSCRAPARPAAERSRRIALIDQANDVHPRTWA